jgi:hypothetical protein
MMIKDDILSAMKADRIPEGWSGLWFIYKRSFSKPTASVRQGKPVTLPSGHYTFLCRLTEATLYQVPPGETVMEDTPFELCTHLGFALHAYGDVLVTGLGLGCVVRGLLANPAVQHVTCIENSADVISLVKPYMPAERLMVIQADALEWTAKNERKFDCAWHDLWTNQEDGELHLDFWHAQLLMNCRKTVSRQGAWAFDRAIKKRMQKKWGFGWIG